MRLRGIGRLRRAVARMRDRMGPRAVILLYHRVTDLAIDPWGLAVSPANFAAQLEVLRERDCVLSISQLSSGLQENPRALDGKVAITFDDGYSDNLLEAKPALEARQLPAIIYMTSGEVGRTREFWWDEMEKIFLQPGTAPATLELTIKGERHTWTRMEESAAERLRIYYEVYLVLQGLPREVREEAMEFLVDWAGIDRAVRASHRALSPSEIRRLADSDCLEIGAHTIRHQALASQTIAVQEEEICGSKSQLEAILDRPVRSFSYPYGLHTDDTVGIVQRGGFDHACACLDAVVRRDADPFRLPRLVVENWDGPTFAARLDQWLKP